MSVDDLVFRPMQRSEADLQLFLQCFNANESPRTMEQLRWQYFDPPAGPLFADLAVKPSGDALAAIYAVFPIRFRIHGQRILGVQSLDTLTDADYRGKGLFSRMAKSLYARCREQGVAIVYGFPNGSSAHGIFNRLEWKTLDPMPVMLRPLRTSYILRRLRLGPLARIFDFPLTFARQPKLPAGRTLQTITTLTPDFDAIWNAFASNIDFAVERDAEYLRWRLQRPGEQYECIALLEGDRPIGLAITAVRRLTNGEPVGKLMELLFDPADPAAGDALAQAAISHLAAQRCGAVWAWNFAHSPNHAALRRAGFLPLKEKWHPAEMHAGARAFTPLDGFDQRTRWYLSFLDSDTD